MKWLNKRLNKFFDRVNPRIVEARKIKLHKPGNTIKLIELKWSDGTTTRYKSSSTCWFEYPMMKRSSTPLENELTNINKYLKEHGNSYPTAHLQ